MLTKPPGLIPIYVDHYDMRLRWVEAGAWLCEGSSGVHLGLRGSFLGRNFEGTGLSEWKTRSDSAGVFEASRNACLSWRIPQNQPDLDLGMGGFDPKPGWLPKPSGDHLVEGTLPRTRKDVSSRREDECEDDFQIQGRWELVETRHHSVVVYSTPSLFLIRSHRDSPECP